MTNTKNILKNSPKIPPKKEHHKYFKYVSNEYTILMCVFRSQI